MEKHRNTIESTTELTRLLDDFQAALEIEQKALVQSSVDHLEPVETHKRQLLNRLAGIHPSLLQRVLAPDDADSEIDTLRAIRQRVLQCREHNRENGALVAQGLKVSRTMLSLLTTPGARATVELYDPHGRTTSGVGKREIGQA